MDKEKLKEIRARIEEALKEAGTDGAFATNMAAHLVTALVLSERSYSGLKENGDVKDGNEAFFAVVYSLFDKEFNDTIFESVLGLKLKKSDRENGKSSLYV